MIDGRAEILDMELEADGRVLRVTFPELRDRDAFIAVVSNLVAPGSSFEIVSDTEVLCKPPGRRQTIH